MHSSSTAVPRRRRTPKSRAEGAGGGRSKGVTHEILDVDEYKQFLDSLGPDLGVAAAKIRAAAEPGQMSTPCHRSTLWRHLHPSDGRPAKITQSLLSQMRHAAELAGPAVLQHFHRATMPDVVQERMEMHFDWLDSFRQWTGTPLYWRIRNELFKRYNYPGGVLWEFRDWMREQNVRESRQDLAIWRIIVPLVEHKESGGIEPSWRDFLTKNDDGTEDDGELVKYLEDGVAWEKRLLQVRGNDLHRAHLSRLTPLRRARPDER